MSDMLSRADEVRRREFENIRSSLKSLEPLLLDDLITDIFINTEGLVSVKKFGLGKLDIPNLIIAENTRIQILHQIAKWTNVLIDVSEYPVVEGTIPYFKARITGILPPWSEATMLTIRKPPKKVYSLEDYVDSGRLTQERFEIIDEYIKKRGNIMVSGGTNTGKTTLLNGIIKKMELYTPADHFYIIQDNAELKCEAQYVSSIIIKRDKAVKAVQLAMRYSPDRIIFGEVRDGFVMAELLDAWNTGHPGGVSSIHSDSCESTLLRMRTLLRQRYAGEIPNISEVVNLIVHLRQHKTLGVIVDEVMETKNYDEGMLDKLFAQGAAMEENEFDVVNR